MLGEFSWLRSGMSFVFVFSYRNLAVRDFLWHETCRLCLRLLTGQLNYLVPLPYFRHLSEDVCCLFALRIGPVGESGLTRICFFE